MFDKVSQVAEQVATRLSRRAFLGKAGQSALALAGVLGGLLMFPKESQAFHRFDCCCAPDGTACTVPAGTDCPNGRVKCRCNGALGQGAPPCR